MLFARDVRIMGLIGCAALSLVTAEARAESPARPCYDTPHIHPRDRRLPANAPAIGFATGHWRVPRPVGDFELSWKGADDQAVAFSIDAERGEYLLRPAASLRPGDHTVAYRELCSYVTPSGFVTTTLMVGPPATLPTTLGTAMQRPEYSRYSEQPTCDPVKVGAIVDLTMSADLRAFRDLTRFTLTYKGSPLPFDTYYGEAFDGTSDYGSMQGNETTLYFQVRDVCLAGQERAQGTLEIRGHVAGSASDPQPLQVPISIVCPVGKYAPLVPCAADGGTPGAFDDAGAPSDAPGAVPWHQDAGTRPGPGDDAAQTLPMPSRGDSGAWTRPGSSGGCSTARSGASSGTMGMWLILAASIVLRRSRRGRPPGRLTTPITRSLIAEHQSPQREQRCPHPGRGAHSPT